MSINLSGELARTLLDLAPDATIVVDATGVIVFANVQVERTFGYAPSDLTGRTVEELLPERLGRDHAAHRAQFAARPRQRSMGEGSTLFGRHKSGREFPVEISLSPVRSADGLLVVAAVRDATVRHDKERGLIESNRAKSRLLAAASHDLRQPVQTLNLLNQAAAHHAPPGKLRDILAQQQAALDTMSALLASVLDVSKLDSGAVQPRIVDCALDAVFERLLSDYAPLANERGLALVVEVTHEGARTDPDLLRRLLGNLVSNAIRYTRQGTVHLSCRRNGDELAITVSDTGVGIPSPELDKIFDEFYQVDRGAQRPEGLGLGLSIVRRLALLLGHRISVESEAGAGTRFTVTLPHAALETSATTTAACGPAPRARGRILVVDDEPSVAQATSLLLELEGFDVAVANCKQEALACVRASAPDLIISDFHLRGAETGAEVVNEVRTHLGISIPAIFVTGDTSKLSLAGVRLENTSLLSKPTRADELLATIRERMGAA